MLIKYLVPQMSKKTLVLCSLCSTYWITVFNVFDSFWSRYFLRGQNYLSSISSTSVLLTACMILLSVKISWLLHCNPPILPSLCWISSSVLSVCRANSTKIVEMLYFWTLEVSFIATGCGLRFFHDILIRWCDKTDNQQLAKLKKTS